MPGRNDIAHRSIATARRREAVGQSAAFAQKLDEIRQNNDLTPIGKQRQIAALYHNSRSRLAKLSAAEQSGIADQRAQLERTLFGDTSNGLSGSDAISTRDAADRAARLENSNQARQLMQRAKQSGDKHLATAVAREAASRLSSADRTWSAVLDDYTADKPAARDALEQLADMGGAAGIADRIGAQAAFTVSRPPELRTMSDRQVEQLASGPADDSDTSSSATPFPFNAPSTFEVAGE